MLWARGAACREAVGVTRQLASTQCVLVLRALVRGCRAVRAMLLALPQCRCKARRRCNLLAACAVIDRCRRAAAASNQYRVRPHCFALQPRQPRQPQPLGGPGSRRRRRRALPPEPVADPRDASFKPRTVAGPPVVIAGVQKLNQGEGHAHGRLRLLRSPPPPAPPMARHQAVKGLPTHQPSPQPPATRGAPWPRTRTRSRPPMGHW